MNCLFINDQKNDRIGKFATSDKIYFDKSLAKAARESKKSTSIIPEATPVIDNYRESANRSVINSPTTLKHKRKSIPVRPALALFLISP